MTDPEAAAVAERATLDFETAFRLARRTFLDGERIDMQGLAAELGIDRSTLFRWVGNRDKLVVDILTSLTDPTLRDAAAAAAGAGRLRVARTAGLYAEALISAPYYRTFLQREPERSLRLITTRASPLQQHVVGAFEDLLLEEIRTQGYTHRMPTRDLAYLIVRVIESFIYADLITGDEPDATKVEAAVAAIMHVDDTGPDTRDSLTV